MVRVKICGLRQMEDLMTTAALGADALGVVLQPNSPRFADWTPDDFAKAKHSLGPFRPPVVAVVGNYRGASGADMTQSVDGSTDPGLHILSLRPLPDLDWGKVQERVKEVAPVALVIDSFSPSQFGGTGSRVDDAFIGKVFETFSLPIIIAGGLNPSNVGEMVKRFSPYGVDVCSGVEASPGVKNFEAVKAFIHNAKSS